MFWKGTTINLKTQFSKNNGHFQKPDSHLPSATLAVSFLISAVSFLISADILKLDFPKISELFYGDYEFSKFYFRCNKTTDMDAIVKWKIWSVRIILTINTKKGKGNNILILECPLMTLTELAIITGLFYKSILTAVIFLARKSMDHSSLIYDSSHDSGFATRSSWIPSVTKDHVFWMGLRLSGPVRISMNISFIGPNHVNLLTS